MDILYTLTKKIKVTKYTLILSYTKPSHQGYLPQVLERSLYFTNFDSLVNIIKNRRSKTELGGILIKGHGEVIAYSGGFENEDVIVDSNAKRYNCKLFPECLESEENEPIKLSFHLVGQITLTKQPLPELAYKPQ